MRLVVVEEPGAQLFEDGRGIGETCEVDVIALEGLHEGFGHAVGLWRIGRCIAHK